MVRALNNFWGENIKSQKKMDFNSNFITNFDFLNKIERLIVTTE
jgi:hypothetical protein